MYYHGQGTMIGVFIHDGVRKLSQCVETESNRFTVISAT